MSFSENKQDNERNLENTLADISLLTKFFRARMNIGYIAIPYIILGFMVHWSLQGFKLDLLANDVWWRFLFASIIAFTYMPYVFIINDYYDAPFDALDDKKRLRNPFCSDEIKNRKNLKLLLLVPVLISLLLGFLISWQAGIITIIALLLGNFYSARPFRFKERPFLDFFVHGFSLGIFFFSLGYYSFWRIDYEPFLEPVFLLLLLFTFADAAWIHIDSAILDYTNDKKSNQNTTVVYLGPNLTIILLKLIIISILTTPAIFIMLNNPLISKFGIEISTVLSILILILPLSYIVMSWGGKNKYEHIRHVSSRYRVYSVYFISIFFILVSNPNFFI